MVDSEKIGCSIEAITSIRVMDAIRIMDNASGTKTDTAFRTLL